jgi:hypothetical protein
MGGTFEKPEAGIAKDLRDLTKLLRAETVFVTHSPIFGVLDPGFGETQIGSRFTAIAMRVLDAKAGILTLRRLGESGPWSSIWGRYDMRSLVLSALRSKPRQSCAADTLGVYNESLGWDEIGCFGVLTSCHDARCPTSLSVI